MIDSLLNNQSINLLERVINFTEQRHELILENIANVSTPGYVQRDASPQEFQQALSDALAQRRDGYNDAVTPESTDTVAFSATSSAVYLKPKAVAMSPAFHDRGVRSIDNLMTQMADNAQAHNFAAQTLKARYDQLSRAISMKA